MIRGLIVKSISGEYSVQTAKSIIVCKPRGIFRHINQSPKVGDIVEIDENEKTINKIEPRKNDLIRPLVANVDKMFLIFSVKEPILNLNLLDRMIAICEYNSIESIIIFTKLDLLPDRTSFEKIQRYYNKIGYKTYTSANEFSFDIIKEEVNDNICIFAGQSGVGKSTLLNKMGFSLKTNEISDALGRGKHTTRHVELLRVGTGYIADTPGFGFVELDMDLSTLSQCFVEFFRMSNDCKYQGCTHINEPQCKIKQAVKEAIILKDRYENYLSFVEEIKSSKKKY